MLLIYFMNIINRLNSCNFFMGLDGVYLLLISNILCWNPLPSVKTTFSFISREESHR